MAANASSNQAEKWSALIKERSRQLGFSFCGISAADFLESEAPRLEAWLSADRHGAMGYMANWFDKRLDPRKLVPGARSVISLLFNYHNPEPATAPDAPRISQYAYGKDYHHVLKRKLKELLAYTSELAGTEISGRVFVDSAPVLERAWAARSGLGWVGKNTNLINPGAGSYFFLAEVILELDLAADGPMRDYCGSCTACIDACPTDAITPYSVDGSRCISYFTIELKDADLPTEFSGRFSDWMFGCDICQEVCPWNRFSSRHSEPAFEPPAEMSSLSRTDWEELTEEVFQELFRGSPVKRTGYAGLKRNIQFLKSKSAGLPDED